MIYITGRKQYCFVTDGLCCIPPSDSIPPTPVKGYQLKFSDQFSTSVNFYSSGGSRGDIYLQSNLSAFCDLIFLRSVL